MSSLNSIVSKLTPICLYIPIHAEACLFDEVAYMDIYTLLSNTACACDDEHRGVFWLTLGRRYNSVKDEKHRYISDQKSGTIFVMSCNDISHLIS